MTTCAKCGAAETERRASFILKRVESPEECINAEACALRAELHDLRIAVLAVADRMTSKASVSRTGWASALRKAVDK